ncbi:MAG: hypothetical protein ACK5H1_05485 [Tenacibaculum sp.]
MLEGFKQLTTKEIVKAIKENPKERRKYSLLEQLKKAAQKSSNVKHHQF